MLLSLIGPVFALRGMPPRAFLSEQEYPSLVTSYFSQYSAICSDHLDYAGYPCILLLLSYQGLFLFFFFNRQDLTVESWQALN